MEASTIDFSPVVNMGIEYAVWALNGLLMAGIAWVLKNTFIGKFFTVDDARARLAAAMDNAVNFAKSRVPQGAVTVEIKNDLIRLATEYVVKSVPDTLKKLGVTSPQDIAARVEAEINKALENTNNVIITAGSVQ